MGEFGAGQIAGLIRERKVSCVEVIDLHLARIDAINPVVNAFCTVLHEQARTAARKADAVLESGQKTGPLHGVPVAIKDLTATAGILTTRGSRAFAQHVPTRDAIIVERLQAAGAIVIGKTNTPEFGHQCITDNELFGPTRNPWNLKCSAGGSSGGSAAAVASGMVPIAEGTDGAGSVRVPAAICGVVGFKPGFGRIPASIGPFSTHSPFFHHGTLARSVEDVALMFHAVAGLAPGDPFSVPYDGSASDVSPGEISRLKIGWSLDLGGFPLSIETRSAFHETLELLRNAGCVLTEVSPRLADGLLRHFRVLWCARFSATFANLTSTQSALIGAPVRALALEAEKYSAADIGRANIARELAWSEVENALACCDAMICPVTAIPAPAIDAPIPEQIDGHPIDPLLGWYLTWPFNLTGHPAISVPANRTAEGLPIGLQLIGRRMDEAGLLRMAAAFERICPWSRMTPTI